MYASNTTVSAEKSRAEIEKLLTKRKGVEDLVNPDRPLLTAQAGPR